MFRRTTYCLSTDLLNVGYYVFNTKDYIIYFPVTTIRFDKIRKVLSGSKSKRMTF